MQKTFPSSAELIAAAAADFFKLVSELLEQQPRIRVLLTGGSLGIEFVAAIGKLNLDWSRVELMFSDERFVPLDHPDRNEFQAIKVWPAIVDSLNRLPAPSVELTAAREQINAELAAEFGAVTQGPSVFDLTILGMGPDAHIASLFPDHDAPGEWVIAESNSPKPPGNRLSLSYAALNRSERIWFLAGGQSKAWAVSKSLDSSSGLPASKVRGKAETIWYLDQELTDAL